MSTLPPAYGIIPARYASSRFPGKPLVTIHGRPMFWHVYTRARRCPALAGVWLATDDERILAAAKDLDVPAVPTSPDHPSGSDRVREAADLLRLPEECVIVNIQGDEPALDPAVLASLLPPFSDPAVQVATLARPISAEEAARPDVVKVVVDAFGRALYFSRAPIPYPAEGQAPAHLGHVGLYAYRRAALARFTELPQGRLERLEKLEQLRLLENGIALTVVPCTHACHGVDRPEDVAAVAALMTETM